MTNACLTSGFMVSGMVSGLSKAYVAAGGGDIDIGMAQVSAAESLVELAIRSENLLRTVYAEAEPPGIYDYEVSEELGEWFAGYLVEHRRCPSNDVANAKLDEMMKSFFSQGDSAPDPDPAPRADGLTEQTVLLCFSGPKEASAFRLGDLAAAAGHPLDVFLQACEDRVETIDDAARSADPIQRSSVAGGEGDELTALHNLKLSFPDGIVIDDLLTRIDEANGSKRSFHTRCR